MRKFRSQYHDSIRLLRCLSPGRLLNLAWLELGYQAAKWLKVIPFSVGPAAVSVEPTTFCNLRCPECSSGLQTFTRPTGTLKITDFARWSSGLKQTVIWINLYFQGEPFLHPDLFSIIRLSKKHRFYTMASTNGHFLDEERCRMILVSGLDRLVISLDGLDQETYTQYRKGGSVSVVTDGIKRLAAMKIASGVTHPYLIIQFLVMRSNEHQKEDVVRWINLPGVDKIELKTAQFYDYEYGHPQIPEQSKYSRYQKTTDGRFMLKSKLPNHCRRVWFSSVITWDGTLLPCCYDKDGSHPMGNLNVQPVKNIWNGILFKKFKKKVLTGRAFIPICKNCAEHLQA